MWEKMNGMVVKQKMQVVMSDAYTFNCSEFGAENIGHKTFASYFSNYQTFSSNLKHN